MEKKRCKNVIFLSVIHLWCYNTVTQIYMNPKWIINGLFTRCRFWIRDAVLTSGDANAAPGDESSSDGQQHPTLRMSQNSLRRKDRGGRAGDRAIHSACARTTLWSAERMQTYCKGKADVEMLKIKFKSL